RWGDPARRTAQERVIKAPSGNCNPDLYFNVALGSELESVRQQIFQDLLQPFRIRRDAAWQGWIELDSERQIFRLRDVAEAAIDGFAQRREKDLLRLDRHCSRFDLRQIQNVVDEGQQVRSG